MAALPPKKRARPMLAADVGAGEDHRDAAGEPSTPTALPPPRTSAQRCDGQPSVHDIAPECPEAGMEVTGAGEGPKRKSRLQRDEIAHLAAPRGGMAAAGGRGVATGKALLVGKSPPDPTRCLASLFAVDASVCDPTFVREGRAGATEHKSARFEHKFCNHCRANGIAVLASRGESPPAPPPSSPSPPPSPPPPLPLP